MKENAVQGPSIIHAASSWLGTEDCCFIVLSDAASEETSIVSPFDNFHLGHIEHAVKKISFFF